MDTTVLHSDNKPAFDMIVLMRANAREYYLSHILYNRIEVAVKLILPLIIAGLIIGFTPLYAFVLLFEFTIFRLLGECFHLYIYDKTGKILINNGYIFSTVLVFGTILAYVPPIYGLIIYFQSILFNIFSVVVFFILGIVELVYLWKYRNYNL